MIDPAIQRRGRFDHVIKVDFASEVEVQAAPGQAAHPLPKGSRTWTPSRWRRSWLADPCPTSLSSCAKAQARGAIWQGKMDQASLLSALHAHDTARAREARGKSGASDSFKGEVVTGKKNNKKMKARKGFPRSCPTWTRHAAPAPKGTSTLPRPKSTDAHIPHRRQPQPQQPATASNVSRASATVILWIVRSASGYWALPPSSACSGSSGSRTRANSTSSAYSPPAQTASQLLAAC